MPKKNLFGIIVVLFLLFLFVLMNRVSYKNKQTEKYPKPTTIVTSPTPEIPLALKKSIFIPYWALGQGKEIKKYDEYFYFGVAPTKEGEIEDDQGKKNIGLLDNTIIGDTTLVVRMMDRDVVESLMENATWQKNLRERLKNLVEKNGFKGVAFDIEIPFSLNTEKSTQITNFVQQMCSTIKTDYKTCDLVVYGDIFYRKRPFDMKALGAVVDRVFIMAYDFHKPMGEPGPNFSFEKKDTYGYDFKTMIKDFSSVVPKKKLGVIFGMYGYDWTLNQQGIPLKAAKSLSLGEVLTQISSSESKITSRFSDTSSKEKSVSYTDDEGRIHVIWYEDEESALVKAEYLRQWGISQISFWAYGYF